MDCKRPVHFLLYMSAVVQLTARLPARQGDGPAAQAGQVAAAAAALACRRPGARRQAQPSASCGPACCQADCQAPFPFAAMAWLQGRGRPRLPLCLWLLGTPPWAGTTPHASQLAGKTVKLTCGRLNIQEHPGALIDCMTRCSAPCARPDAGRVGAGADARARGRLRRGLGGRHPRRVGHQRGGRAAPDGRLPGCRCARRLY